MLPSIDISLLNSFIIISETGNFTHASKRVGRTQSALSLQIKKLEDSMECLLFDRSGRKIKLTEKGEIFLGYARRMVHLYWEAVSQIQEPDIEGEISLGTPEDFATRYLPTILSGFREHHPRIYLNVECNLTLNLVDEFDKGRFDLILVKRDPEISPRGHKVWREPLIWVGADHHEVEEPLSLVLSPQPCIYRASALKSLNQAQKPWRVSYTSPSLAGRIAAVKAGLGITVLPTNMLPEGIHPIGQEANLPELADIEIALIKRDGISKAADMLAQYITHCLEGSGRKN